MSAEAVARERPFDGASILQAGETTRLRWLIRVLLALLVLVVVAGVFAGYSVWQVQSKIAEQRAELAANAAVASTALVDVAAVQRQYAALSSGNCASVSNLEGWVLGLSSAQREQIFGITTLLNTLQTLCGSTGQGGGASDAFMSSYVPAVVSRQKGDYAAAARDYLKAAQVPGAGDDLLARAYEGAAYSNLKLRRLNEAAAAVRSGEALRVDYVFTEITGLKIACQRGLPAADVRRQFDTALAERRQRLTLAGTNGAMQEIARGDEALLRGDPELARMCGYARLRELRA